MTFDVLSADNRKLATEVSAEEALRIVLQNQGSMASATNRKGQVHWFSAAALKFHLGLKQ